MSKREWRSIAHSHIAFAIANLSPFTTTCSAFICNYIIAISCLHCLYEKRLFIPAFKMNPKDFSAFFLILTIIIIIFSTPKTLSLFQCWIRSQLVPFLSFLYLYSFSLWRCCCWEMVQLLLSRLPLAEQNNKTNNLNFACVSIPTEYTVLTQLCAHQSNVWLKEVNMLFIKQFCVWCYNKIGVEIVLDAY